MGVTFSSQFHLFLKPHPLSPLSLSSKSIYFLSLLSLFISSFCEDGTPFVRLELDYPRRKRKREGNPVANTRRPRLKLRKQMPLNHNSSIRHGDALPQVFLSEPGGSSAEVLLYGGQVVSWKNERREELLFMSSKATRKSTKANRGGIYICFPQFGNFGMSEQHGYAKSRLWSLDNSLSPPTTVSNQSSVDLILKPTNEDRKFLPGSLELRLRISLGPRKLTLTPLVKNTDNKPFSFAFSIHNFLSVSDISEVRIEGLETLDYFDNLLQRKRFTEQADAITFDGEVDRVYLSSPKKIAIIDHEKKRTLVMHKEGLPDAVLWNPWEKMAKALPNFGYEDYKTMLSINSAAIENPIVLKPLQEWKGRQELCTVSSSYCSGQLDPRKVAYGF